MKSINSNEIASSFIVREANTAAAYLATIHSGIVLELREMIG